MATLPGPKKIKWPGIMSYSTSASTRVVEWGHLRCVHVPFFSCLGFFNPGFHPDVEDVGTFVGVSDGSSEQRVPGPSYRPLRLGGLAPPV